MGRCEHATVRVEVGVGVGVRGGLRGVGQGCQVEPHLVDGGRKLHLGVRVSVRATPMQGGFMKLHLGVRVSISAGGVGWGYVFCRKLGLGLEEVFVFGLGFR